MVAVSIETMNDIILRYVKICMNFIGSLFDLLLIRTKPMNNKVQIVNDNNRNINKVNANKFSLSGYIIKKVVPTQKFYYNSNNKCGDLIKQNQQRRYQRRTILI